MKKIKSIIIGYNLKPTDAIILKKKFFGLVDHYVLFMGFRGNRPVLLANYKNGINEVPEQDIVKYMQFLDFSKIERFPGTELEREFAIERAWARNGERAYRYLKNNCESFKNWVHHYKNYSTQVKVAGQATQIAGVGAVVAGLATKKTGLTLVGLAGILLGEVIKGMSNDN